MRTSRSECKTEWKPIFLTKLRSVTSAEKGDSAKGRARVVSPGVLVAETAGAISVKARRDDKRARKRETFGTTGLCDERVKYATDEEH